MGNPDGSSNTTHGAYAPVTRTKSVARELALCDLKQAQQLAAWAERIEKIVAEIDASDTRGPQSYELKQVVNEMKNAAFVVERFTEGLLDRIGAE